MYFVCVIHIYITLTWPSVFLWVCAFFSYFIIYFTCIFGSCYRTHCTIIYIFIYSVVSMSSPSHKKFVADNRYGIRKIFEVILMSGNKEERSNFIAILPRLPRSTVSSLTRWRRARVVEILTWVQIFKTKLWISLDNRYRTALLMPVVMLDTLW